MHDNYVSNPMANHNAKSPHQMGEVAVSHIDDRPAVVRFNEDLYDTINHNEELINRLGTCVSRFATIQEPEQDVQSNLEPQDLIGMCWQKVGKLRLQNEKLLHVVKHLESLF